MTKLRRLTDRSRTFCKESTGQDLIEYALVAAIVAVGVFASVHSIQTAIINGVNNGITIVLASF